MKLFVANIAREGSEDELKQMFSECGEVKSVKIIKDRITGHSRGFGFVEMNSNEGGKQAIETLNGKEFRNRALIVNKAREQQHGGK